MSDAGDVKADGFHLVRNLRPLLVVLAPHRPLLALTVALGIAAQAALIATGTVAAYIVGRAVTGTSAAGLRPWIVVLLLLGAAQIILGTLDPMVAHVAAFRVLADLRRRCYDAFERLAPAYLIERRSGDLGATAIGDVELLELFFAHTVSPFVVAILVPTAAALALLLVAWPVALVLLPFVVAVATVPGWLRERTEAQGREERERVAALSASLVDAVQGLREVLAFNAADYEVGRLGRHGALLTRAQVTHARRNGVERAAVDALMGGGVLAVVVVASTLVARGDLNGALLPTCVVLAGAAFAPVAMFTDAAQQIGRVAAASARVFALLTARPAVVDRVTEPPPRTLTPRVRFRDVRFRYAPNLPDALSDVSFAIDPGETVALVGHSGAGKSTCAALLLRMWDVTAGKIEIDGVDIRDLPQATLREFVTAVPQDVYLFNQSVRDNLRLGRPDATDPEIERAAAVALVTEFVGTLPDRFDTILGERGARLSGGQRQRLAIGRALLRDAPVLVLDEAVSNLDVESERQLQMAMAEATAGRTTLVIAHRLSTIRRADRVVVLDGGRVVEEGRYDELVARDGPFARLVHAGLDVGQL